MNRVEIIGDATLYLGDCREILPALMADAIVTDPPYGINRNSEKKVDRGGHSGRKAFAYVGWDKVRPSAEVFSLLMEKATHHIIWGGNYFSDLLRPSPKWLVWNKEQRISQSDGELAWTSLSGALRIFDLNRGFLTSDGVVHPTQKPVALMTWCIDQLPLDTVTIMDPYMGSGSTGVAAIRRRRKFVGIEAHEPYFEAARLRIIEAMRQPEMPLDAKI